MSKFLQVLENHIPSNVDTESLHGKVDLQWFFQDNGIPVDRNIRDYPTPSFVINFKGKNYRITVQYVGEEGSPLSAPVGEEEAETFANTPEEQETQQTVRSLRAADAATSSSNDPSTQQAKKRLGDTVTRAYTNLATKVGTATSRL